MARGNQYFRGRPPRSSGVARDWDNGPGGTGLTQLTATGSAFLGTGFSPTGSELTIMRTRGLCEVHLEATGASDGDGFFGAVGIGVCPLISFQQGIASVPTPITELSWDGWLYHQFISVHQPDITFGGSGAAYQRFDIDSKAKRKHDNQEVVYAVVEVVEIGTATLNVFFNTRQLIQDSGR